MYTESGVVHGAKLVLSRTALARCYVSMAAQGFDVRNLPPVGVFATA